MISVSSNKVVFERYLAIRNPQHSPFCILGNLSLRTDFADYIPGINYQECYKHHYFYISSDLPENFQILKNSYSIFFMFWFIFFLINFTPDL